MRTFSEHVSKKAGDFCFRLQRQLGEIKAAAKKMFWYLYPSRIYSISCHFIHILTWLFGWQCRSDHRSVCSFCPD